MGNSFSCLKLAHPQQGCVLINWSLCCLLVAIWLLIKPNENHAGGRWDVGTGWLRPELRRRGGSWLHTPSAGSPPPLWLCTSLSSPNSCPPGWGRDCQCRGMFMILS